MNDSIEVLKNKISMYEYILEAQQDDIQRTRITLEGLKKELALKELEKLTDVKSIQEQ